MTKMSEETKTRLRALSAKKRKLTARQTEPAEWLILVDKAQDDFATEGRKRIIYDPVNQDWARGYSGRWGQRQTVGLSLKYVPDDIIKALATRLPCAVKVRYQNGPNSVRVNWVFPDELIRRVVRLLGLDPDKYCTPWNPRSIKRCRVVVPPPQQNQT